MTNMSGKGIWRFKGGVFELYSCLFFQKKKKRTVAFLWPVKKNNVGIKVKVMQAYQDILSI